MKDTTISPRKTIPYGDKRNYPKINIFVEGVYYRSTTWARTCKEAVTKFIESNPNICMGTVTAHFDKCR